MILKFPLKHYLPTLTTIISRNARNFKRPTSQSIDYSRLRAYVKERDFEASTEFLNYHYWTMDRKYTAPYLQLL